MDVQSHLQDELRDVEWAAASLPWAGDRDWWRAERAVRLEDGEAVLTVDLHGLTVQLVDQVLDIVGANCRGDTIRLIHGRGRHSVGGSVLRDHVRSEVELRGFDVASQHDGHIDTVP